MATKAEIAADARPRRKSSKDRRAEILRAAVDQILETRSLPLSMNDISDRIGASRALVYAHFSDQDAVVNAVLADYLALLEADGLLDAIRQDGMVERGVGSATIYLRHIARHGPVIHIILRDAPHGASLSNAVTLPRNRSLRALANAARSELSLSTAEAIVFVELLLAIPDELGSLCHRGDLDLDDALGICQRLIRSGIESVMPAPRKPSAKAAL